jgi:hypothetical protein
VGFRQLRFKIGGGRRVGPVARCRESRLDLLRRQLRNLRVAAPFGEQHQNEPLIADALGPLERHERAGQFRQGVAIGGDGLLEPCRPALPSADRCERDTKQI